jgi:hypothetical protein
MTSAFASSIRPTTPQAKKGPMTGEARAGDGAESKGNTRFSIQRESERASPFPPAFAARIGDPAEVRHEPNTMAITHRNRKDQLSMMRFWSFLSGQDELFRLSEKPLSERHTVTVCRHRLR